MGGSSGWKQDKALQKEWNEFGKEAFQFMILEQPKKPEAGFYDKRRALQKLGEKWLAEKQSYGEKGYNGL